MLGRPTFWAGSNVILSMHAASKAIMEEAEGDLWTQQAQADAGVEVSKHAYRDYARASFFYAAIFTIMSAGASAPYVFKREKEDGELEDVDHPLLTQLLTQPNPYMTWYDLTESLYAYLELSGEGYWEIADNGGEKMGLYPVRPDLLRPLGDKKTFITHYEYKDPNTSTPRDIDAESIVRFVYFHPTSFKQGMGSAEPAAEAADLILKAGKWNRRMFTDAAIPEGALSTDQKMTPRERKQTWQGWLNRHQGENKTRLPAILTNGLKWSPMGIGHKEMDFKELIDQGREDVLATMGVPPILVGWLRYVNYNTAQAQEKSFWTNTMLPKLTKVEGALNMQLLPALRELTGIPNLVGFYDLKQIPALQDDADEVAARTRGLYQDGLLTRNEGRVALGVEAVDDKRGDKFIDEIEAARFGGMMGTPPATGDDAATPDGAAGEAGRPAQETALNGAQVVAALQIVDRVVAGGLTAGMGSAMLQAFFNLSPEKADGILKGAAGAATVEKARETAIALLMQARTVVPATFTAWKDITGETYLEKANRQQQIFEAGRQRRLKVLFPQVSQFFQDQGRAVVRKWAEMSRTAKKSADLAGEEWTEKAADVLGADPVATEMVYKALYDEPDADGRWYAEADAEMVAKFEVDLDDLLADLDAKQTARLGEILSGVGAQTIKAGGTTAIVGISGQKVGEWVVSEAIYLDFIQHSFAAAGGAVDTGRMRLAKTMAKGLSEGQTSATLAREIRSVYKGMSVEHSAMIAQTETQGAYNLGALDGYRYAGIEEKTWMTSGSGNERQDHLDAEGQTVPINEPFIVGGEELQYPGDWAGSFGNTHGCECSLMPKVRE